MVKQDKTKVYDNPYKTWTYKQLEGGMLIQADSALQLKIPDPFYGQVRLVFFPDQHTMNKPLDDSDNYVYVSLDQQWSNPIFFRIHLVVPRKLTVDYSKSSSERRVAVVDLDGNVTYEA